MYFVVHLQTLNKNVVVPATWIYGIAKQIEKFVNVSLNPNQIFLVYYTTNDAAFVNGRPDEDFPVNFSSLVKEINSDGSFDGSFFGKMRQFKRK